MEAVWVNLALILKLAPVLAIWYGILYLHQKKKKPLNVYDLKPQEFEIWYRKNQSIQLLLALGYLLLGAAELLPGYWFAVPVIFLLAVYILRIVNNMSRIHRTGER